MNTSSGPFLLGVVFFGLMAVLGVVQVHRKKEKIYYASAVGSFLVFLGFVFIFLNQFILVLVLLGVVSILSIVGLPKVLRIQERQLKEMDLSAPLRRRDFLSNSMWLKLAYRWGVWKIVGIFALLAVTVIDGVSLYIVLSVWGFIDLWYVLRYTISATIGTTILFHHQINNALKESKRHA